MSASVTTFFNHCPQLTGGNVYHLVIKPGSSQAFLLMSRWLLQWFSKSQYFTLHCVCVNPPFRWKRPFWMMKTTVPQRPLCCWPPTLSRQSMEITTKTFTSLATWPLTGYCHKGAVYTQTPSKMSFKKPGCDVESSAATYRIYCINIYHS